MPEFAFYRPHANIWFKPPVRDIMRGQRLPTKYGPFFDHVLATEAKVCLTVSMVPPRGLKGWVKRFIEPFELWLWCWLNDLPLRRIRIVWRRGQLARARALFIMYYGNLSHEDAATAAAGERVADALSTLPVDKIVHLTHYVYNAATGAANLARLGPRLLVAENNLAAHSPFFDRCFGASLAPFRTLPYTAAARFRQASPAANRINKMVATGSITYRMRDPEFIAFYGVDELQPLRRSLLQNAADYEDEMDCLISDLDASRSAQGPTRSTSPWARIAKTWQRHPQLNYYRRNIVDVYNSYTMFVVPEEICNLPAIGFVEGMACGCVFLGLDDAMYTDVGMVPGVHYLAYDGSIEGLMATVRAHQDDAGRERLLAIGEAGRRFVTETLSPAIVYASFMADLRKMTSGPQRA